MMCQVFGFQDDGMTEMCAASVGLPGWFHFAVWDNAAAATPRLGVAGVVIWFMRAEDPLGERVPGHARLPGPAAR
ncbi:hypothetical protein SAMN05661093_09065 [Kibdelosporangium aridum]|uniref:Uncharacterized protein n=1 Tax=Kibdelosporangium aridum TaxID=2030 RepID=A0A1W2FUT2_KIBAR|nr:hypothetical protein SAMN05661093_09065 [Kibdelosporangium aridum]